MIERVLPGVLRRAGGFAPPQRSASYYFFFNFISNSAAHPEEKAKANATEKGNQAMSESKEVWPRSHEEKRRAVSSLLQDEEWWKKSDYAIAREARVSQPFVSKLRRQMKARLENTVVEATSGRHV